MQFLPRCARQTRRLATGTLATTGAPIKGSGSIPMRQRAGRDRRGRLYRLLAGPGYTQVGTFDGAPAAKVQSSYNRSRIRLDPVAYGAMTTLAINLGRLVRNLPSGMHSASAYVHPVDASFGMARYQLQSIREICDMTGAPAQPRTPRSFPSPSRRPPIPTSSLQRARRWRRLHVAGHVPVLPQAHASGFLYMLRWEQEYEFITKVVGGVTSYGGTDVARRIMR